MPVAMDILAAIGNTSIVRLRHVVPQQCADVLMKLEWENPTGSMNDRMALAVISRPEADVRLKRDLQCVAAAHHSPSVRERRF